MNTSMRELDAEIAHIEARIAAERLVLVDAVENCKASFKDTATSPKTLMALTGVGFALGKLMFGRKAPESPPTVARKAGLLGLLTGVAGTAFGLMQPKFGVSSVARWAATRYFAQRAAARRAGIPVPPIPAEVAAAAPEVARL